MNSVGISQKLTKREIQQIFSKVLSIDHASIGVFADETELVNRDRYARKIVVKDLPGEFPRWFDIYPAKDTDLEIAMRLVEVLNVQVLISDDTVNPYRWIVCTEKGQSAVYIDSDFFDATGGFKIERIEGSV